MVWRPLLANGKGLDEISGNPDGVAYNADHSYTVDVTGVTGTILFTSQAGGAESTTAVYAKLDHRMLGALVRPWPGA